jgi:acetyl-CoA synthetase
MNNYPYQIKSEAEYQEAYALSINNPIKFWQDIANCFTWIKKWDTVFESNFITAENNWFKGGQLNITQNCLDRHVANDGNQTAIIWESNAIEEPSRKISYTELLTLVNELCWVMKNKGVKKGDRVCIYMGMIPEQAVAVLACARIGAIHSVIFGGFSSQSIADRLIDAQATFIITCDGAYRGNKVIALKSVVDEALIHCPFVNKVLVYNRTNIDCEMKADRDLYWHQEMAKVENQNLGFFDAAIMEAEDPLFILYTSGSTGKPKGVVHSTAGYMIWANYTFVNVFQYQPGQIHFCTADIGWITGHSYIIYGPLSAGATTLMFEGIPTWPTPARFWQIVEKHKVNILYTAPTAIRSLMAHGTAPFNNINLSSLKVLGTVGEPINEEAWQWYNKQVGKGNCPIVDTWWQTETGGIMISNMAGITPGIPAHATLPLPGIVPCLVDEHGVELLGNNVSGNLCIKQSWPGIVRTTYNNHERCLNTYFSTYNGMYFTGDGCLRNENGQYRITGRVDDVLNVSGHRIGTAEIENAVNEHIGIIESAVVGYSHDIKGQGIYVFAIIDPLYTNPIDTTEILNLVAQYIGSIAKPDKIQFVSGLPKTRSGKIMRRFLRKIADGQLNEMGDTSTLLDPSVIDEIIAGKI